MFRLPLKSTDTSSTKTASVETVYPNGWRRPADWLELEKIPEGEYGINILHAVFNDYEGTHRVQLKLYQNDGTTATIDWGDGSPIEEKAGRVWISHVYNYAEIPDSTISERGYKQVVIKIKETTIPSIIDFGFATSYGSYVGPGVIGALDLEIKAPVLTKFFGGSGVIKDPFMLERLNIVGENNIGLVTFENYWSLRVIENFDTTNAISFGYCFYNSKSVHTISFPPNFISKADNFDSLFRGSSIREFPAIDLAGASISMVVYDCFALRRFKGYNISEDLRLEYTSLNVDAMVEVFNNLIDLTGLNPQTISITKSMATETGLTQAHKDIALNKNWTIVE